MSSAKWRHLAADGLADGARPAQALPRDEEHVQPVGVQIGNIGIDRMADDVFRRQVAASRLAQQPTQGEPAFLDQGHAQIFHVAEVAIEGGRHHAGLARHLAQPQAAKAAALAHQLQGRLHQPLTRGPALTAPLAHAVEGARPACGGRLAAHAGNLLATEKARRPCGAGWDGVSAYSNRA